jgi:CRISPR-associated protein Cas1
MLAKKGDRLVVRGPKPRLELIEGGPQLFLPLGVDNRRPTLTVVTSSGEKHPTEPIRRLGANGAASRPPKSTGDQIELPLFRVGHIVVASNGVSISTDLIEACCERGIRLSFLTRGGKPFAMLSSPMLTATVLTRREQLAAYGDERGVEFAQAIVRGKLGNQAALLRYFGKYLKAADPAAFTKLSDIAVRLTMGRNDVAKISAPRIDDAREALLAIEGSSGRSYWSGVRLLLPKDVVFASREHRGATDPVNSALNYGYGMLYTQVWGALMNAGLEPFAGFLHVDRPGKPSLVLDMVEEFRQAVVDRAVIAAFGKGTTIETQGGMLTDSSRRSVAQLVLERLEGEVNFRGQRHKLKSVIQIQARNLASALRDDASGARAAARSEQASLLAASRIPALRYKAFSFKW